MANFDRPKDGMELDFQGIDLLHPVDSMPPGKVPYAQNVRRYQKGRIAPRNQLTSPAYLTPSGNPVHSLRRLNDTTPGGPAGGAILISGSGGNLYAQAAPVASQLSGNPLGLIPFRPNQSVPAWMYVSDSTQMLKVRSDGLTRKQGIKEPQTPPNVTTQNTTTTETGLTLHAASYPWTNVAGQNANFNYGQNTPTDGLSPLIIGVIPGAKITITVTGSAHINGATHAPGDTRSVSIGFPDSFLTGGVTTSPLVIGAFTDGAGNVLPAGGQVPTVVAIGASATLTVPPNAVELQVGIDSQGNTFGSNNGSFALGWSMSVSAIATVMSILGSLTCWYFGDSPHSGPVAAYIWRNPNDTGGNSQYNRSTTSPAANGAGSGSITGNSFLMDTTPGDPTTPMAWTQLNEDGTIAGTISLFQPSIEPPQYQSDGYADFNFCLVGSIFVPAPGTYAFQMIFKDAIMWGIGGGASWAGKGTIRGIFGQTETAINGLPLIDSQVGGTGGATTTTYSITFPSAGIYPIEIDFDYWKHSGRTLQMTAAPTPGASAANIPPLPAAASRELVQYKYRFRASESGAKSNPSPPSTPQSIPVAANVVTPEFCPDPQCDVVDYFRVDASVADYTYVATGPNTSPPTPISDEIPDDQLGNDLLETDQYEPFPSIDLPQKGTVNITGGVIQWASGNKFNIRYLFGTIILIGSPTSIAYVFVSRPYPAGWQAGYTPSVSEIIFDSAGHYQQATIVAGPTGGSTPTFNHAGGITTDGGVTWQDQGTYAPFLNGLVTQVNIPDIPDAVGAQYYIATPTLAAQQLPFVWGPTDNVNFAFGVGDKLRPGVMYWYEGNNLDAAPQTNQEDITDPNESLINGAMAGGKGVVFSEKRAWMILPNFFNAEATSEGVSGSTWSLQGCDIDRGLYMPWCVAIDGFGNVFFRVKDGIHFSPSGNASKSITDDDLYPLFPHEDSNEAPQPVVRGPVTIHPPDDTQPAAQTFAVANGYLYYDYIDTGGTRVTLVFDIAAKGWVFDIYQYPVSRHALEDGTTVNGTYAGCVDGSIRFFSREGNEPTAQSYVMMPAYTAADQRASKHWGDLYIEGGSQ